MRIYKYFVKSILHSQKIIFFICTYPKILVSLHYETKGIHKYSTNGNSLHFDYYADIQILSTFLIHETEFYILQISIKYTTENRLQR